MRDCNSCAEKCPQAELAHQAALGRRYATNELVAILKKVESGELVPVVRCKDCKHWCRNAGIADSPNGHCFCHDIETNGQDFCSYGERRSE